MKSWGLVHRGPVKLQGKNPALAVPTIGENLCQPWELSLQQVRGSVLVLPFTHSSDHAGKGSRAPRTLCKAAVNTSALLTCSIATFQED